MDKMPMPQYYSLPIAARPRTDDAGGRAVNDYFTRNCVSQVDTLHRNTGYDSEALRN